MRPPTKLWVLTLNYSPEPSGFAPHATAIAEHLAKRGHEVTVITGFPFAPRWSRWPEYRRKISMRVNANGVNLRRVSHFIPRRPGSLWQRLAMETTFSAAAMSAVLVELLENRTAPDVLLYIGAQPAIAMLARILSKLMGVPYLINVNDLAARAAADVGIVSSGGVQRVLERFEYSAYRGAARASVLCRSFGDALVARGFPEADVRVIRSPVDLQQIRPLPRTAQQRTALGIPVDAFVVLFAGSMGLKQGLENLIRSALHLRTVRTAQPVHWVLVGDGEARLALEQLVRRHDLSDVHFVPFQPAEAMSSMLAAADVFVLNQLTTVKDTVVPSKLLTYMAAGRPVIAAVNPTSQGSEILRDANGGLLVAPENPEALAGAIATLSGTPVEVLAGMGARNRAYAEEHFDQTRICIEHERLILESLERPSAHAVA